MGLLFDTSLVEVGSTEENKKKDVAISALSRLTSKFTELKRWARTSEGDLVQLH